MAFAVWLRPNRWPASEAYRSRRWGCIVAKKKGPRRIAISQVRSKIGRPEGHRRTLRALGFTRHQQTRIHDDTPAIRGMINQVKHLVVVRDAEE